MTKNFKQFNESVINLSKVRKFPENHYDIYDLDKKDLGKYLNTWFPGKKDYLKKTTILLSDEMWTVKKVDEWTAARLYWKYINPISVDIQCPVGAKFEYDEDGNELFEMISRIHSIDDSSFSIWFHKKPLEELEKTRTKIMEWVNSQPIINGQEFLDACVSLGGDEKSINYD